MFEWLFFWRKDFCDREYNHVWGYWKQYRIGTKKEIIRQTRFCLICNFCEDGLVTLWGEASEEKDNE